MQLAMQLAMQWHKTATRLNFRRKKAVEKLNRKCTLFLPKLCCMNTENCSIKKQKKRISNRLVFVADLIGVDPSFLIDVFDHNNYKNGTKKSDRVINAIRSELEAQISRQKLSE